MYRFLLIVFVGLHFSFPNHVIAVHDCGKACVKCPRCPEGCCKLDVSEGKLSKHYWTVETEQICVPRFVFPWQNWAPRKACDCGDRSCQGCDVGDRAGDNCGTCGTTVCTEKCPQPNHNGGRVITVRKLKKNSYECPVCSYKWSVKEQRAIPSETNCVESDQTQPEPPAATSATDEQPHQSWVKEHQLALPGAHAWQHCELETMVD